VRVQIALGDLADPGSFRNALRGVDTVIHLAAAIRDQPARGRLEELNGLATARLLRAAERAGVKRFVFFSAIGATAHQRTRFFRSKALAEEAVLDSGLRTTIFRPSIVYDRDDPWVSLMRRLSLLPVLPISGRGRAAYQPIWAEDVAGCIVASLKRKGSEVFELAGPEVLTYNEIAEAVATAAGRQRRLLHIPLPLVRWSLIWLRWLVGPPVFATWEEAELMEVPMTTRRGTEDARALGVEPHRMVDVLAPRR
jgi:NADH dehydrogenase